MNAFQLVQYLSTKPHEFRSGDIKAYINSDLVNKSFFINTNLTVTQYGVSDSSYCSRILSDSFENFQNLNPSFPTRYKTPSRMNYACYEKQRAIICVLDSLNKKKNYIIDDNLPIEERFAALPELYLIDLDLARKIVLHSRSLRSFIKYHDLDKDKKRSYKDPIWSDINNIIEFHKHQAVKDYYGQFLDMFFMPLVNQIIEGSKKN